MDDCDGRVICPVYSRFAAKNMSKESPDCPRAEARGEFYIKVKNQSKVPKINLEVFVFYIFSTTSLSGI